MILKKVIATPQVYIEFPVPIKVLAEYNNGKITGKYLCDYINVYPDKIEHIKYLEEYQIHTKEVLCTFSNQSFSGLTDRLRDLFETVDQFEEALWTQLLLNRLYDPEYEDNGLESLFEELMTSPQGYIEFWRNVIYQNIHSLIGPSEEHSMMAAHNGFFISNLIVNTLATPIEGGLSISQMSNKSYLGGAYAKPAF